jgi:hypothetical protein
LSHHRKSPAKCSPQILFGWPKQFWEIIKNINPGFDHLRRDFDFILGRAGLSCFFDLMYMRRARSLWPGAPAQKRPDRSNVALDMATIGEQHRFHTERDKGRVALQRRKASGEEGTEQDNDGKAHQGSAGAVQHIQPPRLFTPY